MKCLEDIINTFKSIFLLILLFALSKSFSLLILSTKLFICFIPNNSILELKQFWIKLNKLISLI